MILRQVKSKDTERLVQIYESFYPHDFPLNLTTAFYSTLCEKDDKIVGFGWLDATVEATIILDLKSRPRDKFEALRKILEDGCQVAKKAGFDQLHAFPRDPKFSGILEKHLHFNRISTDCLYRNLGD